MYFTTVQLNFTFQPACFDLLFFWGETGDQTAAAKGKHSRPNLLSRHKSLHQTLTETQMCTYGPAPCTYTHAHTFRYSLVLAEDPLVGGAAVQTLLKRCKFKTCLLWQNLPWTQELHEIQSKTFDAAVNEPKVAHKNSLDRVCWMMFRW